MERRTGGLYALLVLSSFLPSITEVPHDPQQTGAVIAAVLSVSSIAYTWLSPLFHVATLLLLVGTYYRKQIGRILSFFFGVTLLFAAVTQHIAYTQDYGLAIITSNLVLMSIVAAFWFAEAYKPKNEYVFGKLRAWRYWVIPFMILAFWFPISATLEPDFSLLLLLTSTYGIMFCPTVPVMLGLLTLAYPRVDKRLLTMTGLAGLIIGFWNATGVFLIPGYTYWMAFLHTPLILISAYSLLIGRIIKTDTTSVGSGDDRL